MDPRHLEIAHDLMDDIDEGRYAPGVRLPTEDHLMEYYSTSRNTVRRALQELSSRGRIDIKQGSGSTVREYRPVARLLADPSGTDPAEALADELSGRQGAQPAPQRSLLVEEAGPAVARALDLGEGERSVVVRVWDGSIGGRLWERSQVYLPLSLTADSPHRGELVDPGHAERDTKEILAAVGFPETSAAQVVGARMPSLKESGLFALGPGVPLLVHEKVSFSGERPVAFTSTLMPADRYQLLSLGGEVGPGVLGAALGINIHER
ncbi:GntR family transcriptional regulator [Nocardiopsis coralliicola]